MNNFEASNSLGYSDRTKLITQIGWWVYDNNALWRLTISFKSTCRKAGSGSVNVHPQFEGVETSNGDNGHRKNKQFEPVRKETNE